MMQKFLRLKSVLLAAVILTSALPAQAQITAAPGDPTGTVVTPAGAIFNITGGAASGANLFHSFGLFGLTAGQTANFVAPVTVQNILARVVGGSPSVINGTLQSVPNLYLMNPAGIVFGPSATLNVSNSFLATTANGIRVGGSWFSASGANNYPLLNGDPNALGLTMSQPGAIVNAANLAVGDQQNLTLIGGTVINTGTLAAPRGQITVAAVAGENLVRLTPAGGLLSLDIRPPTPTETQPTGWTLPIATLPALLTGSGLGNATGVAVNPDGSVSLIGSGLRVNNGDVVVPAIAVDPGNPVFTRPLAVVISAAGNLTTGDIRADDNIGGRQSAINLAARGNIQAGILSSTDTSIGSGITLTSTAGNVTVNRIFSSGGKGIDIFAAGLFQALGADTGGATTGLKFYVPTDPGILPFLVSKTGATSAALTTSINASSPFTVQMIINTPASVRTTVGPIRIRYAGGIGTPVTPVDGVTLQGGVGQFFVGPNVTAGVGDRYLPAAAGSDYATFVATPFSLVLNEAYSLSTIPTGASGTVGAIIRTVTIDGSFTISLQNRVLGTLPQPQPQPQPQPNPTNPSTTAGLTQTAGVEAGQTIQRQLTNQATGACNPVVAIAPTNDNTRGSVAPGTPNPCTPADNDAQILKILEEPPANR